ncbi:MAG: ABC transporter ATP-binding protein [Desulfuromonadaceae bacterium]|nr:ABC transporter ATP-binding protein [Desulfuromonadaceae bacterium]
MSGIELQQVSKIYPSGHQQVQALVDLTLSIDDGEFCVLAGPSGSGKTTLLNLIGCLDRATSGTIRLFGQDVATCSARQLADFRLQRIGFVFQSYNLIPVLSAEENVAFPLMLRGVGRDERRRRALELLTVLGLVGLEHRRPADLSGGQQQRVAVARALVGEPSVVLADEPTANLDTGNSVELLEMMHRLNRERGTTFIFSSHDPLVIKQAERVIELQDGRLKADNRRCSAHET